VACHFHAAFVLFYAARPGFLSWLGAC
jgi:hypothetical protein